MGETCGKGRPDQESDRRRHLGNIAHMSALRPVTQQAPPKPTPYAECQAREILV